MTLQYLKVSISITACDNMTYGLECAKSCSRCRNGTSCNYKTGNCDQGCDEGKFGNMCQFGEYIFIVRPQFAFVFYALYSMSFSLTVCPSTLPKLS